MTLQQLRSALIASLIAVAFSLAPLFLQSFGLFFSLLSNVPLLYLGFRDGFKPLILSTLFVGTFLAGGTDVWGALTFMLIQGIPILLLGYQGLQGKPGGLIASQLTALNIILITLFTLTLWALVGTDPHTWLTAFPKIDPLLKTFSPSRVLFVLPGLILCVNTAILLMNGNIALRLLQNFKKTLRPYPLENEFEPIMQWDLAFWSGMLLFLIPYHPLSFWGANLMILSTFPLLLVGLRIFYVWFLKFQVEKFWYFVLLFMMIILMWPLVMMLALGLLEPVLKLYPRFKKQEFF